MDLLLHPIVFVSEESEEKSMMSNYGLNGGNMLVMILSMGIGIVLLVVLAWAGIRWLNNRTTNATRQTKPLSGSDLTASEILNQRYARGEIDVATFDQMRERLEAADNIQQERWAEERRPVGEKLFDGSASGPESW